jgi:hypothetical protein
MSASPAAPAADEGQSRTWHADAVGIPNEKRVAVVVSDHLMPASAVPWTNEEVVTSRAYLSGALLPSVDALLSAIKALRATGSTEDVVGLAIPLAGDPNGGEAMVRTRREVDQGKKKFNLIEFLMTAIDPHGQGRRRARWRLGPGRNVGTASEIMGNVTRWMVGIQTFRIPLPEPVGDETALWVLARPNHAAAIHKLEGDSHEGYVGMMATLGVPASVAAEFVRKLEAGDCLLTTCETDPGRARRDQNIMRRAGATSMFEPQTLTVEYGVRPA